MKKRRNGKMPDEAYDRIPRLTITLTDETCWLTRHDRRGAALTTYPVATGDVANAFNQFGANTGLLPADTLFWSASGAQTRIGVWLPPARRTILFASGKRDERLTVPLPGFVFVGEGVRYSIFATAARPASERDMLYRAPLPNVHPNGAVCAGTVNFPKAGPGTIHQAATLFFESVFNSDLSTDKVRGDGGNLLKFLRSLKGDRVFPKSRLIATTWVVGELINGEGDDPDDEDNDEDDDVDTLADDWPGIADD